MRARRALLVVAVALGCLATVSARPSEAIGWAPVGQATIHPGVQMVTGDAQCTSNFIFTRGTEVLIGYAAHCAGLGEATDTNGCTAKSLPLGTKVTIDGATRPGVLVYSSWLTMQKTKERNATICDRNDFALVRIDPADRGRVNPSIPHWGGPTGLNGNAFAAGASVYSYGNSGLRGGLTQLSPKIGTALGTDSGGWSHLTYTVSPGIPGDSGSALLDSSGKASGVLSTIGLADHPASNRFSSILHVVYYASVKGFSVKLANGTQPFNANQVPIAL
jgi:hypothetical protein